MPFEQYQWNLTIPTYACDQGRFLRPNEQMKLQQEIGEMHLEQFGLSYAHLYEKEMAFVLSGTRSHIFRPPTLGQAITITTWSRGTIGPQFYRCYDFSDDTGALLISSVSSFVLINPKTHRLVRPGAFEHLSVLPHFPDRKNACEDPSKLIPAQGLPLVARRSVLYSDVDYNHHLNNTVYAQLLCDYLPGGIPLGSYLSQFQIRFAHDALPGEDIDIFAAPRDGQVLFYGEHTRGLCFTASACLCEYSLQP